MKRYLRETRAIAGIKQNPKYLYKFVKNNSMIRARIETHWDEKETPVTEQEKK